MKITNCLRMLLTIVFVLSVLTLSDAGQQGFVVSPNTGKPTVKRGTGEVAPQKEVPVPTQKNNQRTPSTSPQITTGPPKVPTIQTPKPNIIVQSIDYTVPQGRAVGEPFKEGEGTTLYITFRNIGNAKSSKNHKYTISCVVKSGGPECPVQSQTKPFGKEIAPNSTYPVLMSAALKKAGEYQITAKVVGQGTFPPKTVTLKVVPAPKQDIGKKPKKPTLPNTTSIGQTNTLVSPGIGDSNMKQRSGNAPPVSLGPKTKMANTVKFKTHLSVKLQGKDFTQWGDSWAGTSPEVLKFRWKTVKGANPFPGKWQVSTRATFNPILKEGDAGVFPGPGDYLWFFIDFKNIASLAQGSNKFLVRVVPEPALYAPSPPVLVNLAAPESHTVFNFPPKITGSLGTPGLIAVSPGGILHLKGIDFGTDKGSIIIYGEGFPDGKLPLKNVVWVSNSRVKGEVPLVTGVKDQKVKVEVVTHDGLVSNRHEHWFHGTRERRTLKLGDPAITVVQCDDDANINDCWCNHGVGSSLNGYHANYPGTVGYDEGWDKFRIELKNGWKIVHGEFSERRLTSSDEKLDGPRPEWVSLMTSWKPKFHWVVSPGDIISYEYTVTIEGPKGVPHY